MKESSRRDNKYRSGSTLCRGSKERHTRWQINTPFPVASRGALNSNVRRMTPRSVCALNAPPTRFACSHYVGARWSEQYTEIVLHSPRSIYWSPTWDTRWGCKFLGYEACASCCTCGRVTGTIKI